MRTALFALRGGVDANETIRIAAERSGLVFLYEGLLSRRNLPVLSPTTSHFPHPLLLLLLLLCYGAHLVFSSGTVSSRSTPRKLRGSSVEAQLIHSYATQHAAETGT